MVIIEINRDYAHFDRILGEHRWSEFLQKPTKEESGRVTQVFYCTYNTGRIVQKNGACEIYSLWRYKVLLPWLYLMTPLCRAALCSYCLLGWKRIDVDETWFKAWSPKNR